jgi:hypothetical protein
MLEGQLKDYLHIHPFLILSNNSKYFNGLQWLFARLTATVLACG